MSTCSSMVYICLLLWVCLVYAAQAQISDITETVLKSPQAGQEERAYEYALEKDQEPNRSFARFKVGVGFLTGLGFGGSNSREKRTTSNIIAQEATGVGGISLGYIEPQYGITDDIGIGLRYETLLLGGGSVSTGAALIGEELILGTGRGDDPWFFFIVSLQADYYVTKTRLRPSVGVGFGFYSQLSEELEIGADHPAAAIHADPAARAMKNIEDEKQNTDVSDEEYRSFGIAPRVRLNLGHVVLGLTYHITFNKEVYNFLAINAGWEFGGGRL